MYIYSIKHYFLIKISMFLQSKHINDDKKNKNKKMRKKYMCIYLTIPKILYTNISTARSNSSPSVPEIIIQF